MNNTILNDNKVVNLDTAKRAFMSNPVASDKDVNINLVEGYLKKLDFNLLRQGMKLFLGRHDFYNFCSNNDDVDYFETIDKFTLRKSHDTVIFDIYGSGFKRYMVRMIIGTLLALNEHQITFDYIKERLDSSHDKVTSYNAPPQGLYLMEVSYDQK